MVTANLKSQQGISLPESLLVIVILGFIALLVANIPNALMLISKSRHLSLAKEIAGKQVEDKRTVAYANLVDDTSTISDSRLSLLPGGSGTLVIEPCNLSICTNGESIKVVTVTVHWQDNNKLQEITLKTMIGEGGINQ